MPIRPEAGLESHSVVGMLSRGIVKDLIRVAWSWLCVGLRAHWLSYSMCWAVGAASAAACCLGAAAFYLPMRVSENGGDPEREA